MTFELLIPKNGVTNSISPHAANESFDLIAAGLAMLPLDTQVLSFQRLVGCELKFRPFDACTRINIGSGTQHVVLVGVQAASSYCDLILWDLAHALPLGGTLTLFEPTEFDDCILGRAYFAGVFDCVPSQSQGWSKTVWTKIAMTRSELDQGLDAWTFGLPVGELTQDVVDRLTKRIAEFGLGDWELMFAVSREPKKGTLRLPDQVTLVHCPGATITEKKNSLAKEARYPNLCIFHDRVELPRNFRKAVEQFGDDYAICGFQQLLFDSARDSLERYSDYHTDLGTGNILLDVDGLQGSSSLYVNSLETRLRFRANFAEAHPADYDRRNYLTGSMYLAKRSIWRLIGQHPRIEWNELEDVEFGERAIREYGVPSRINPYALGFTSRLRAVLVGAHDVVDRRNSDSVIRVNSNYRAGPAPKGTGVKPLEMRQRAWKIFREFGLPQNDFDARSHIFTAPLRTQQQYADYWIQLLYRVALPRQSSRVRQFLVMFSNAAYGFSFDPGTLNALATNICSGAFFIDEIIRDNYFIRSLANVPNLVNAEKETTHDVLFEQVMRLWRRGGDYIYPYQSFDELWDAICGSL